MEGSSARKAAPIMLSVLELIAGLVALTHLSMRVAPATVAQLDGESGEPGPRSAFPEPQPDSCAIVFVPDPKQQWTV